MRKMKGALVASLAAFAAGTLFGALALGGLTDAPGSPDDRSARPGEPELTPPSSGDGVDASAGEGQVQRVAPVAPAIPEGAPEEPVGTEGDLRIAAALTAWQQAEARIADLQVRLASVERVLATRLAEPASGPDADRPTPPKTPDERRNALVQSGVERALAEDILWREGRRELDRLALRDRAAREGWAGTPRFREELSALEEGEPSVREEIGDSAWDRYLYLTGENNRVRVESVIPGSAAEAAGVQPGDLIEAYAGERLFEYGELRSATTSGVSGELVPVRVRRGGGTVDAWVPRGPLGIRLDMTRVEP